MHVVIGVGKGMSAGIFLFLNKYCICQTLWYSISHIRKGSFMRKFSGELFKYTWGALGLVFLSVFILVAHLVFGGPAWLSVIGDLFILLAVLASGVVIGLRVRLSYIVKADPLTIIPIDHSRELVSEALGVSRDRMIDLLKCIDAREESFSKESQFIAYILTTEEMSAAEKVFLLYSYSDHRKQKKSREFMKHIILDMFGDMK